MPKNSSSEHQILIDFFKGLSDSDQLEVYTRCKEELIKKVPSGQSKESWERLVNYNIKLASKIDASNLEEGKKLDEYYWGAKPLSPLIKDDEAVKVPVSQEEIYDIIIHQRDLFQDVMKDFGLEISEETSNKNTKWSWLKNALSTIKNFFIGIKDFFISGRALDTLSKTSENIHNTRTKIKKTSDDVNSLRDETRGLIDSIIEILKNFANTDLKKANNEDNGKSTNKHRGGGDPLHKMQKKMQKKMHLKTEK